jgi:hypothetical protein|tara:strand:+ start:2932 stop:3060 length:129 start_codon:yes stop_codon:yes gene_type:complete
MNYPLPHELLSTDDIKKLVKQLTLRCLWLTALALASTNLLAA